MLPVFGVLSTWLTPFWLLAAGAFLGMLVLVAAYGVLRLLTIGTPLVAGPATARTTGWRRLPRKMVLAVHSSLREGFLFPVLVLGTILSVVAVAVAFIVPFESLTRSVMRIAAATSVDERTIDVPADAKDLEVDLGVVPAEVSEFEITADRNMYFSVELPGAQVSFNETRIALLPNETFGWDKASNQKYLFYGDTTRLFLTNNSALPATAKIFLRTQPEHPEATTIPWTAGLFIALVVGFLLLRAAMPRVMAVASTTAKEALAQPLLQIVMAIGVTFLTITVFIPYNTFGDDVSMLKDTNLSFLMILSIFVALWTASVGLADEIEGRTALTVLSKPIGRPQFLLGKFVGVLLPVLLMFLFLGTLFLLTVSFKTVYDARESAQQEPIWQRCYAEMIGIVPGLALAFMETVIMAAIAVAIATRLPMLANLSICFTIYIVGHLLPLLVISKKVSDPFGIIQFMGQFFAVVLPVLEHFNIYAAIAGGVEVPWDYLGWALVYCVLYSGVAMLFALLLFEDRDLA
jgi:ABC-type transport system involved in multi-copper enzyme maturation permease subunit